MKSSLDTINHELFKKIIVIFWAIWWLIAWWTDVVGGLAHLGIIHASWAPDTNYPPLVSSLQMYSVPNWVPAIFFMAILVWSTLATVAFIWASAGIFKHRSKVWMRRAKIAFIVSLTFWLAFFLADQLVMKFDFEENHMVQGGFQLLTFLALYLLPNRE